MVRGTSLIWYISISSLISIRKLCPSIPFTRKKVRASLFWILWVRGKWKSSLTFSTLTSAKQKRYSLESAMIRVKLKGNSSRMSPSFCWRLTNSNLKRKVLLLNLLQLQQFQLIPQKTTKNKMTITKLKMLKIDRFAIKWGGKRTHFTKLICNQKSKILSLF